MGDKKREKMAFSTANTQESHQSNTRPPEKAKGVVLRDCEFDGV
jgi:hypothetical protein